MTLSLNNLMIAIGIGYDIQLKAADNLFFSAAVDYYQPEKPMFGGSIGDSQGNPRKLYANPADGFTSYNNGIDGDPVTVRQIATAEGPRYQICDGTGKEIMVEKPDADGPGVTHYTTTPRYMVKADGVIYDCLVHSEAGGAGDWAIANPAQPNGGTGLPMGQYPTITADHYVRPVGRISFKGKDGATLARAQDDLQRIGSIVQLLTRLLESIQDESKGFNSIIR